MGTPTGMIRLSVLAAENGMTLRCLKRRLLKLDRRIRRDSPEGPFVLQGGEGGAYSADASVLYLHARGYLHERLRKEPLDEMRDLLREMRDDQLAQIQSAAELAESMRSIVFAVEKLLERVAA